MEAAKNGRCEWQTFPRPFGNKRRIFLLSVRPGVGKFVSVMREQRRRDHGDAEEEEYRAGQATKIKVNRRSGE